MSSAVKMALEFKRENEDLRAVVLALRCNLSKEQYTHKHTRMIFNLNFPALMV